MRRVDRRAYRPSPDINSKIIQINFNPFWTVPVSIVRKDLIPKMRSEPDYLTKNHIRIYDAKNNEQPPSQCGEGPVSHTALFGRLVRSRIEVFDQQLPVMRGHFPIMMF